MGVRILLPMILVRMLNKEEFGTYQQFYNLLIILTAMFSMGFHYNLFYYYPLLKGQERVRSVLTTFYILLVLGVIGAMFINLDFISGLFFDTDGIAHLLPVISICLALSIVTTLFDSIFIVEKKNIACLLFPVIDSLFKVVIILYCAIQFGSISSIIYGYLAYLCARFIVLAGYVFKNYFSKLTGGFFSKDSVWEQLRYGLSAGVSVVIRNISQKFDKLYAIQYFTPVVYANYSIAFMGIPGITILYDSFSKVIIPPLAEYIQKGEHNKGLKLYRAFVSKNISVTFPLVGFFIVYASHIIAVIYTPSYREATPYFQIYLLTLFIWMLSPGTILRASGNTKIILRNCVISAVITIPLTIYMIKVYDLYGAIIGAIISYALPSLLNFSKEMKVLKSNVAQVIPWKNVFIQVCISAIGVFILHYIYFFSDNEILFLGSSFIIYALIVVLLQIMTNTFCIDKLNINSIRNGNHISK